jgi:hypothetical protein
MRTNCDLAIFPDFPEYDDGGYFGHARRLILAAIARRGSALAQPRVYAEEPSSAAARCPSRTAPSGDGDATGGSRT